MFGKSAFGNFCNNSTTSSSNFGRPLTIESLKKISKQLESIDTPILVRVSPAAMAALKKLPQPQFIGHPGFATASPLSGLRVDLDLDLDRYEAEVEYRSGKITKLDLTPKKEN